MSYLSPRDCDISYDIHDNYNGYYGYENEDCEEKYYLVQSLFIHPERSDWPIFREGTEGVLFRIKLMNQVPGYSGHHDIALLLLNAELEFSDHIQPLCLPYDTGESSSKPCPEC